MITDFFISFFILNEQHFFNDLYARDTSSKIKAVKRSSFQAGKYVGCYAPIGYLKSPEDKHILIPDPATAPLVRRIFELCAGGMGPRSIATALNQEGVLCPSEYLRRQTHDPMTDGPFERQCFWGAAYIRHILQNERFLGSMVQGRCYNASYRSKRREKRDKADWIVVEGTHEPIISRELFQQVQQALRTRRIETRADSPHRDDPDIFSGLFRCEACGTAMRKHRMRDGSRSHYICGRHHENGNLGCSSHYINCEALTRLVREDIRRNAVLFAGDTGRAVQTLTEQKCAADHAELAKLKAELADAQKQLSGLDTKLRRAYEDNLIGKLPDHIFTMFAGNYDSEKAALQAAVQTLTQQVQTATTAADNVQRFAALIQKYTSFEELDSFMLHQLIDKITIYETPNMGRKRKGKEKIITIYYKFVGALQ